MVVELTVEEAVVFGQVQVYEAGHPASSLFAGTEVGARPPGSRDLRGVEKADSGEYVHVAQRGDEVVNAPPAHGCRSTRW